MAALLNPLRPAARAPLSARARVHRYRVARGELVAVERNVDYHMSEDLKQAGGNELLEHPVATELTLAHPAHVYDLRAGKYFGLTARVEFILNPWQPSLFALLTAPLAPNSVVTNLLTDPPAAPTS